MVYTKRKNRKEVPAVCKKWREREFDFLSEVRNVLVSTSMYTLIRFWEEANRNSGNVEMPEIDDDSLKTS